MWHPVDNKFLPSKGMFLNNAYFVSQNQDIMEYSEKYLKFRSVYVCFPTFQASKKNLESFI